MDYLYLLSIAALVTTASSKCPYTNPVGQGMRCLEGAMLVMDSNSDNTPRVKRGGTVVVSSKSMTPDSVGFTEGYLQYICGDNGKEMVKCATMLYDNCSGHESFPDVIINLEQLKYYRSICLDYMNDINATLSCVNEAMMVKDTEDCITAVYDTYLNKDDDYSMCSRTGEVYNCMQRYGGEACGHDVMNFLVVSQRVTDPVKCIKIIDAVYVSSSVSQYATKALVISMFSVLTTLYLF